MDWKNAKKRNAKIVELTAELELCVPSQYVETDSDSEAIAHALNDFLKSLSVEKRLIFVRRYWYADSISDISKRYGIGESKVKTTLYRTRNKLKTHLEKEGVVL